LLACLRARSGKTATTCRAYFRLPRCTTAVGVPAEEQGSGSARVGGGTAALGLRLGAMPGCKLKKRFQGFPVAGCRAKFGFLAADLCSKVEGSEAEPEVKNSAPGHGSHHEGPRTETDLGVFGKANLKDPVKYNVGRGACQGGDAAGSWRRGIAYY